jgi:integrase
LANYLTAGLPIDPRGEVAFGSDAARWLTTRLVKGHPLTPATRQGYRRLLQGNVLLSFDRTPLRKIAPERVRQCHAELVASAGNDQAAKSYRVLRAILNTAVADNLIAQNPCRVKGAGIDRAAERPFIDTTTVRNLGDVIQPRLRAFVHLASFATLRSGELLGLERRDIDLVNGPAPWRRSTAGP